MPSLRTYRRFLAGGLLLLIGLMALDLAVGRVPVRPGDPLFLSILLDLRMPRVATALLAGAALALSGAQMQAVFRNPLADPHIMGVSAGAGLGAAIATLLMAGVGGGLLAGLSVSAAAFLGAGVISVAIIWAAGRLHNGSTLLVFGILLGFILSAITAILEYSANEESLKFFYIWSAGSFAGRRVAEILLLGVALILGLVLALIGAKGLDLLLFGEDYAALSGAPVRRIRARAMISACLLTGATTAFCGPLGFVGIVAPHIVRRLTGTSRHARVLPLSMIAGGILTLIADLLSQAARVPLPVGSTLALVGIPLILMIILPRKSVRT
ncbi:MAG: iron ABC transporter permease [Bacteroidales bacterium]|nr:iron ABC transporter permease [Bacteroidales bacterium]